MSQSRKVKDKIQHLKSQLEQCEKDKQLLTDGLIDVKSLAVEVILGKETIDLPPNAVLQIPAGILTSLLTSVVDLKMRLHTCERDIKTLRAEKSTLQRDVGMLQSLGGITFVKFPRLPTEIRMSIWQAYLDLPKVICFSYDEEKVKYHVLPNPLYHVCQESRNQIFKYIGCTALDERFDREAFWHRRPRHQNDIYWRVNILGLNRFDHVMFFEKLAQLSHCCGHVALSFDIWYRVMSEISLSDVLQSMNDYGVTDITLVIGSVKYWEMKSVVFRTPRSTPRKILSSAGQILRSCSQPQSKFLTHVTQVHWEILEQDWEQAFESEIQFYKARRQESLDSKSLHS